MSKVFECRCAIDKEVDEFIRRTGHEEELYGLLESMKRYSMETFEHSLAVADLSGCLAERMGLDSEDVIRLKMAGLYHDVGKLTIPLNVLHKEGILINGEWELMKKHADAGYRMLLPYVNDVKILLAVKQHHERLDGSGYPDSLSGGITEYAKIVMLADVYDGLTGNRAYRSKKISSRSAKRMMEKDRAGYEREYLQIFLDKVVQSRRSETDV